MGRQNLLTLTSLSAVIKSSQCVLSFAARILSLLFPDQRQLLGLRVSFLEADSPENQKGEAVARRLLDGFRVS